jgi:DNA-binding CsgD family transcriptional regulator
MPTQQQLDRIEWKLDMVLALMRQAISQAGLAMPPGMRTTARPFGPGDQEAIGGDDRRAAERRDPDVMLALRSMSIKQHASVQMVLRGASNREIAERFGVSENTAKVYLRSIAKKLGVKLRTQIAVKVLPVLRDMPPDEYQRLAKGLPKDWDETYSYARREDDPYWTAYTGSRVGRHGDDLDDDDDGDGLDDDDGDGGGSGGGGAGGADDMKEAG